MAQHLDRRPPASQRSRSRLVWIRNRPLGGGRHVCRGIQGFNDKTWLGPTGYPHSEEMRIVERYRRVDQDTLSYDMTITDPKAYTKPVVTPHRTMKLKPNEEISEQPCVWSQENEFAQRIRNPATPKPGK